MRLLDTTTIKLSEFHDADIPPYAILSQTWGKNEVSFQDLYRVKSKRPQGYYKIARCCALAASQGYKWVWIDTCCIDKTSSSELSEAINSMYRWNVALLIPVAFASSYPKPRLPQQNEWVLAYLGSSRRSIIISMVSHLTEGISAPMR